MSALCTNRVTKNPNWGPIPMVANFRREPVMHRLDRHPLLAALELAVMNSSISFTGTAPICLAASSPEGV